MISRSIKVYRKMSKKVPKRAFRCTSYTAEAMRLAYFSVKTGQYTGRRAAVVFNVPYGTLNKKLSGRAPVDAHGAGRPIEISTEYEQKFAAYLKIAGKYGHGYSRREIQDLVSEFVNGESIKTRWPDGKPGHEWLKNFSRRHPEIKVQKDEHPKHKHLDGVDPFMVYQFYDDLKALYEAENITKSDGDRIYNVCEMFFQNSFGESCLFPERCAHCASKTPLNNGDFDTSLVVSVRADGKKLHPLVIFQGRCVLPPYMNNKKVPETAYYTASSRKWMEGELFSYWFENVFLPQIPDKETRCDKSVVLLFNGNSLHVNIRCLAEAVKHNVILVKLPPKLNKHLQPLSRTCLSVLKSAWDEQFTIWEGENLGTIQKLFGQLLGITWNQHFGKRIIRKAFKTTGVYPTDKERFPISVFDQQALKKYLGRGQITVRKRKINVEVKKESVAESTIVSKHPILSDAIEEQPSTSKSVTSQLNLFERFSFKKRSSSSTSGPLDLSKRKKNSDSNEEKPSIEIKQEI